MISQDLGREPLADEIATEMDDTLCECNGEMHKECSENPMVNEKYASKIKFSPL